MSNTANATKTVNQLCEGDVVTVINGTVLDVPAVVVEANAACVKVTTALTLPNGRPALGMWVKPLVGSHVCVLAA